MGQKQQYLFGALVEDWIAARRGWWRPATLVRVMGAYENHLAALRHLPLDEIRKSTLEAWLGQRKVSLGSRQLLRTYLAAMFNWAIDEGRVETNPAARIRVRRVGHRWRTLQPGEAADLLREVGPACSPLWLFTLFGLYTGLRLSNLLALDRARIRRGLVVFPDTMMKAARPFEMPLHPVLAPYVERLPVGLTARRVHLQYGRLGLRPHDLRHTFGTWLASVAPWPVVAACLGHTRADNSVTAVYVHITIEQMREALLRLPRLV